MVVAMAAACPNRAGTRVNHLPTHGIWSYKIRRAQKLSKNEYRSKHEAIIDAPHGKHEGRSIPPPTHGDEFASAIQDALWKGLMQVYGC
jgi:hypothetical protein